MLYAGWSRQTSGVSVTLQDVVFVDNQNGWCVGDSGVILRTSTGGVSWARQTSGTNDQLRAVCFPDLSNGWAVGGGTQEVILKTTDGGSTWAAQSSGIGLPLGGVSFTDPRNGWVSGAVQDANGKFYALHTSDGGKNWTITKVYPQMGVADGGLTRIFAKDSNHVWAGGGDILHAPPLGILGHSFYGVSWHTDIGWFSHYYPNAQPRLFGIHFPVDTLHGWTCGTAFDPSSGQPLEDQVIHTGDGVNWSSYYTEIGYPKGFYGIHFTDLLNGWVVGGQGTIRRTTNGGTAWSPEPSGVSVDLFGLHFADSANGWACGGNGAILKYGGVGVEEKTAVRGQRVEVRIKATPNPFTSFATIPGHKGERFELYDIAGKLVGNYRGDRIGADVSPGVYFLKSEAKEAKPVRIVKVR